MIWIKYILICHLYDAPETSETWDQTKRRGNLAGHTYVHVLGAFCYTSTIGKGNLSREECRQESAEMRQSLSYDPEVATATDPSSQLEEGASKASPNKVQLWE